MENSSVAKKTYLDKYIELRWPDGIKSGLKGVALCFEDREALWEIKRDNGLSAACLRSLEQEASRRIAANGVSAKKQESDRLKPILVAREKSSVQPVFGCHTDWNELSDREWLEIVSIEPKFCALCDWVGIWERGDCGIDLFRNAVRANPTLLDVMSPICKSTSDYNSLVEAAIEEYPELAGERDISGFSAAHWRTLLVNRPELAEKFPCEKFADSDAEDLFVLALGGNANAEEYVDWNLNSKGWLAVLTRNPQYGKRCKWSVFDGDDWVSLLRAQPIFASECAWTKLSGGNWVELLSTRPELSSECLWAKLNDRNWVELLRAQPKFAGRCQLAKFGCKTLAELITNGVDCNDAIDRKPISEWDGESVFKVVTVRPEFIFKFTGVEEKFKGNDGWTWFAAMLLAVAKLGEDKRGYLKDSYLTAIPWKQISAYQKFELLKASAKFAKYFNPIEIGVGLLIDLLRTSPDLASQCDWHQLKSYGWRDLLTAMPEYADCCDWTETFKHEENDCGASPSQCEILKAHPYLAKYCCWEAIDADTWARCYNWKELCAKREKEVAEKKQAAAERKRQEDARKKEEQELAEKAEAEKHAEEEKLRAEEEERKAKEREEADQQRAEEERKERAAESRRKLGRFLLSIAPSALAGYGVYLLYTGGDLFHAISLGAPLIIAMIMHWCGSVRYQSLYIMYAALVGAACGYGYLHHNWDHASVVSCIGLGALIQNAIWHRRVFHSIALFLAGLAAGGLYLFGRWGIGTAVIISMCFVIGLLKEGKNTWTWWRWTLYVLAIAGGIVASFCNHEFWGVAIIICSGSAVMDKE